MINDKPPVRYFPYSAGILLVLLAIASALYLYR
jgi:hypothetical protein